MQRSIAHRAQPVRAPLRHLRERATDAQLACIPHGAFSTTPRCARPTMFGATGPVVAALRRLDQAVQGSSMSL